MEPVIAEGLVRPVAPDAQVDVARQGQAYALARRADVGDRQRSQNTLGAHGAHRLTVRAGDVEAVVKIGFLVGGRYFATYLAEGGGDFAHTGRGVVGPARC